MLLAAVMLSALTLAPPPNPGPWMEVGAAVTSRPGKLAHFFRSTMHPTALAVVASSSSAKPIRMTWFGYCEFNSDDDMTQERQATVTGVHRVVAYPPVLTGATDCTVVVTIRVSGGRATSAVFSY
ncbi:MAG TPA: hypothetical protein VGH82_00295 [Gaiellaceae bacterium]|jgi:hypothetical protein